MHDMEKLREMLCDELEKVTEKGELTAGSLDIVDKLTHSIKSIDTIMAMEDGGYSSEGGYSGRSYQRGGNRGGSSHRSYNRGSSYQRGRGSNARRDSMGRYSSDGYSWDDGKEDLIEQMRDLAEDAQDSKTKQEIEKLISKMEQV